MDDMQSAIFRRANIWHAALVFLFFFPLYVFLAWLVSGGDVWWVIDYVDGQNVFHGDDAYRFFLARSAWVNPDLYTYNFVLPGQLFLDGILISLSQGDIFYSRCFHAALGAGGLSLIYLIGAELGLSRLVVALAVLIMGLLPRYALMSLSFYGEVWVVFFLLLSLIFYLKEKFLVMSVLAGWLPLFRPESVFYLFPLCLSMLLARRYREFALLLLPGTIYFFYVFFSLSSLSDYHFWRFELRYILSKLGSQGSAVDLLSVYSSALLLPALIGAFLPSLWRIWPFVVGSMLWLLSYIYFVSKGLATFENRYFYTLLPVIILSWVACISFIKLSFFRGCVKGWVSLTAIVSLSVFIVSSHILNTDNVRQDIVSNGYASIFNKVYNNRWRELYGYHPSESLFGREEIVDFVEELLVVDPGVDKLAVESSFIFYLLDPQKIPSSVTVGFITNNYYTFYDLLGGRVFIQHPGGRMFSYLEYGVPAFGDDESRVVVVAPMPVENYPYTWVRGSIEMYLFSYGEFMGSMVGANSSPVN